MRVLVILTLLLTGIGVVASCVPDFRFEPPGAGGAAGSGGGAGAPGVAGAASAGESGDSSCNDSNQNGKETDKDCGGENECARCKPGRHCRVNGDCEYGSCIDSICQAEHCTDQAHGDNETDFDCGSPDCPKCGVGQSCKEDENCKSNACDMAEKVCIPTGCDDGKLTGAETDLDCGGETFCPRCDVGRRCEGQGDCAQPFCVASRCTTQECTDQKKSPGEEQIDCGGTCPKECDPQVDCKDLKLSGLETDVDCGGGACAPCADGKNCENDSDCVSEYCFEGKCANEACREDPLACSPGGSGGTGGTGSGGSGGGAGVENGGTESGGTSGGPQAGTAGRENGGSGGMGDPPLTVCTGCARLVVPLSAANQVANYVIFLNGPSDFSRGGITYRVYKEAGSGGILKGYIQYGGNPDFRQVFQSEGEPLSALQGWTELTWEVSQQEMPTFNKTNVSRIGLQVAAGEEGPWSDMVLYVDWIRLNGVGGTQVRWDFDTMSGIRQGGGDPGKNVLWLNQNDNPVPGALLEWLGGAEE